VHTGNSQDIADALLAGANGIEHGSTRDRIPDELLSQMAKAGVSYDPTLCVVEAFSKLGTHSDELLSRSLVQQVVPAKLLENTRKALRPTKCQRFSNGSNPLALVGTGKENLKRAYQAGVPWLQAATPATCWCFTAHRSTANSNFGSAEASPEGSSAGCHLQRRPPAGCRQSHRLHPKGRDADLVLVDGNPPRRHHLPRNASPNHLQRRAHQPIPLVRPGVSGMLGTVEAFGSAGACSRFGVSTFSLLARRANHTGSKMPASFVVASF
jgi:hypothetical protein